MTLIVEMPDNRAPERDYILDVLLGEFLGLQWRRVTADRSDTRISLADHPGEIHMSDTLLSMPDADWRTESSMPSQPLAHWDAAELSDEITLVESRVPVLYGDAEPRATDTDTAVTLPIDIFGSAFFMLSRYEEVVTQARDEHDRFPAWASIAYQGGFLSRPIVDEYVEILWAAIKRLWPQLERKQHQFRTLVSCDVDSAISFRGSWPWLARTLGGDVLKRRSPLLAVRTLVNAARVSLGNLDADPHWHGLKWIMDVNEAAGNSVAFYFIPEITDNQKDKPVSLNDPRMRAMLWEMHARGHEIGLHPGYNTYNHPEAMKKSAGELRRVMQEEGIQQPVLGGRQHFLRWQTPNTARLWEVNGLVYDTTLSYADRPGFRCGTCREYTIYDVVNRKALRLRERPLVLMECSVIADRYLGLGYSDEAFACMTYYKGLCRQFNGDFTLLWHNSHFNNHADKHFYRSMIGATG